MKKKDGRRRMRKAEEEKGWQKTDEKDRGGRRKAKNGG